MFNLKYNKKIQGFTLIEVMVVVLILGLLATIVVPKVVGSTDKARISKAKQDIAGLESALTMYRLDNFFYPTTDQGLESLVEKPTVEPEPKNWKTGGYIARLPNDPWGEPYKYLSPGIHGEIDIYSGGPNLQTEDDDVGNWDTE